MPFRGGQPATRPPLEFPVRVCKVEKNGSRASMCRSQLIPAPAKMPLRPCQVSPSEALTGEFRSVTSGEMLPSRPMIGAVSVTVSVE